MYSSKTRVLHLNDVAGTATTLVSSATAAGRAWSLRRLPVDKRRPVRKGFARLRDGLRYLGESPHDIVHIHYGPNGYYGWLKRSPYVLHLHGSDLRVALQQPVRGRVIRRAAKRAAAVVVSTPDLLEAARKLRDDALYLPNPISARCLAHRGTREPVTNRVVFNARWDESKGAQALIHAARQLLDSGVDVVGVDWGQHKELARSAGVRLLPLMTQEGFVDLLSSAQVVVGQVEVGALGIADLQTLACGRPLVGTVACGPESDAPIANTIPEAVGETVLNLLSDENAARNLADTGRQWVSSERTPAVAIERLEEVYRNILR